jgi:hypothetical protein
MAGWLERDDKDVVFGPKILSISVLVLKRSPPFNHSAQVIPHPLSHEFLYDISQ